MSLSCRKISAIEKKNAMLTNGKIWRHVNMNPYIRYREHEPTPISHYEDTPAL
jgi:hypothetical protein